VSFHTVFVYGTLRPGFKENEVRLKGCLYDLGWYPGVLRREDDTDNATFLAEKVVVDDDTLNTLDRYEGYDPARPENSLYTRVMVNEGGNEGWLYVYNGSPPVETFLVDGDWLAHTGEECGSSRHLLQKKGVLV
jgi:gamma-glutamylcyclotransferase (GGCT)/AIG2-like uncharacterized protein YtfP